MYIGNQTFGNKYVFAASGVMNVDGSGWPHHHILKRFLPNFSFANVVPLMKTVTVEPRAGNMPLRGETFQPAEKMPACIAVDLLRGEVVNAVGLTNPGIQYMLSRRIWECIKEPFGISIMFLDTEAEQLDQARRFVDIMSGYIMHLPHLRFIELNVSCPNTGHALDISKMVQHIHRILEILRELMLPIMVKINLETTPATAYDIAKHPAVAGIVVPNTTPWGSKLVPIDWKATFPRAHFHGSILIDGVPRSPLHGVTANGNLIRACGLSTPEVFPYTCNFIKRLREMGFTKTLIALGIYHRYQVSLAFRAGCNAIGLGAVTIVRPWRVGSIIREANRLGPQYDHPSSRLQRLTSPPRKTQEARS